MKMFYGMMIGVLVSCMMCGMEFGKDYPEKEEIKIIEHDEKMAEIAEKHELVRDKIRADKKANCHYDHFSGAEVQK